MNIPLPPGATGDVYLRAFDELVAPVVERFAPTWLLVSAGFDAHRDDPLTELGLSAGDFAAAHRAGAARWSRPDERVAMLEGGYDLDALAVCTDAFLGALAGERPHTADGEGATNGGPGHEAVDAVCAQWARSTPG